MQPAEPARRYEREQPGELIHLDIKKLGRFVRTGHRITGDRQKGESRGAGHEFVHVAIDDASRIAFSQIRTDEKKESAIAFLEAAVIFGLRSMFLTLTLDVELNLRLVSIWGWGDETVTRVICVVLFSLLLSNCSIIQDGVTPQVDKTALFKYGEYCAAPPDARRSALSYAETGFAYVEQQCGVFFDNLTQLTQTGRFSVKALNATNLGAQSILQAAKVAASNVTIVGSAITLTEAIFSSFVEQYAFSPYLYKIRELTWQAFQKHTEVNSSKLTSLRRSSDDYCSAYVLIQQHASICSISYLQMLFDQQVATPTRVVASNDAPSTKPKTVESETRGFETRRFRNYSPAPRSPFAVSPSFTVR